MRLLAHSEHYSVSSEYESVFLTVRESGKTVLIGDFYGDPEGAIIDRNGEFAAVFGCGVIVYYLTEPFEDYRYGIVCGQWKEFGRDGGKWVNAVTQTQDGCLLIEYDDGTTTTLSIQ